MRKFTATQTAKGIVSTFEQGNYSLAVQRLRAVQPISLQQDVIEILKLAFTNEQLSVLKRYARELF